MPSFFTSSSPTRHTIQRAAGSLFLATLAAPAQAELIAWWDFNSAPQGSAPAVDKRAGLPGLIEGGATITADGGGRSGAAGDRAAHFGTGAQRIRVANASFADVIATSNAATLSFWLKQTTTRAATMFRMDNPLPDDDFRAFSAHLPWSNATIYFDTVGCCDSPGQRLSGPQPDGIDWTQWHHVALVKNADIKEVWIDAVKVLEDVGSEPFVAGFTQLVIGNAPNLGEAVNGDMDDVAFYSHGLTEANILALKNGASPSTLATVPLDSDGDGLPDGWETGYYPGDLTKLQAAPADADSDGLPDASELGSGSNPKVTDTDGDGWTDGVETGTGTFVSLTNTGTDPLKSDTDADGLRDGAETKTGTFVDANNAGTDPLVSDTDGDTVGDGTEVIYGSNPLNVASIPGTAGTPFLLAWWKFDDSTNGAVAVDTRAGHRANVVNALYTADAGGRTGAAGDKAMTFTGTGQRVEVTTAPWMNLAGTADKMTVAFWQKLLTTPNSSSFWFYSTSSNNGNRGFQAHSPYGDGATIYFDTAGCCNALQRISGVLDPVPDWFTWRHLAYVKNGPIKEVYIDGVKMLEGTGAAPLIGDFTQFRIGSDNGNANIDGDIDDFAIYATALSATDIGKLAAGATPDSITGASDTDADGLPDAWEYIWFPNDLTKLSAAGDFDNDGLPDAQELTKDTIPNNADSDTDGLKDGAENGTGTWVSTTQTGTDPKKPDSDGDGYQDGVESNTGTFVSETNTGTNPNLNDTDADGFGDRVEATNGFNPTDASSRPFTPGQTALLAWWPFNDPTNPELATDQSGKYPALIEAGPAYSASGEGRTGQAGDHAMTFLAFGGRLFVENGGFLNFAGAEDSMTFTYWQKLTSTPNSSAFWADSPGSGADLRGFQAHTPWGDNTIYFDHSGCCDAGVTRLSGPMPDTIDLTAWHLLTFIKNEGVKQVWIDNQKVLEGVTTLPLPTDFTSLNIGGADAATNPLDGILDDFAVYAGGLTPEQIARLAAGETPAQILGTTPPVNPDFRISSVAWNSNGSVTLVFPSETGATYAVHGVSDLTTTPWPAIQSNIAGTGNPVTVVLPGPFAGPRQFFRVVKQ